MISIRIHGVASPSSRSSSLILFGEGGMRIAPHFEMDEITLTRFRVDAGTRFMR
jgi:hypothetical protein